MPTNTRAPARPSEASLDAIGEPVVERAPDDPGSPSGTAGGILVRIVLYGPEASGKSATARALGERLGQPVTAPTDDEGRVLFEWVEYVGGRHEGRPISTQVVAVTAIPGERALAILDTADAVVFVADSASAGVAASAAAFADLRALDATRERPLDVVVQANKRDLDAVPLDELRQALGLDDATPVIETVATDGDGVRQAYVYAVRHALRHLDDGAEDDRPAWRQRRPADLVDHLLSAEAPTSVPPTSVPTDEPFALAATPPEVRTLYRSLTDEDAVDAVDAVAGPEPARDVDPLELTAPGSGLLPLPSPLRSDGSVTAQNPALGEPRADDLTAQSPALDADDLTAPNPSLGEPRADDLTARNPSLGADDGTGQNPSPGAAGAGEVDLSLLPPPPLPAGPAAALPRRWRKKRRS